MNTSFSLYQGDGVRVYFNEVDPDVVAEAISSLLSSGYSVAPPDPRAQQQNDNVVAVVVSEANDLKTGRPEVCLHLYNDNAKLEYKYLTVYHEDLDKILPHLPGIDLDDRMGAPPPKAQALRLKAVYKPKDLVVATVAKTDNDGNVIYPKDDNGNRKSDYPVRKFSHVVSSSAGTKLPAPSTNGAGPAAESGKPTTLKDAIAWAKGMSIPAEAASAGMQRLVRELFDVPKGQERDFLLSAENGKVDMLLAAYVQWAEDWVAMAEHAAAEEQELPF